LKEERNALQEKVFPRLREFCMQHGARFQAIDLRWGVSEQASLDQQAKNICLDEITRCQKTTPRPNFIVLLGDRYGWRPLPSEIPADEFEEIERRISDEGDRALLTTWYRRDDNEGHARAMLRLRSENAQLQVLQPIISKALSVRQTEELVRRMVVEPRPKPTPPQKSPELRALEDKFRQALGTKVSLTPTDKGGRLAIYYYSDEELQGIYDVIVGD
jgi:hypothetical protein